MNELLKDESLNYEEDLFIIRDAFGKIVCFSDYKKLNDYTNKYSMSCFVNNNFIDVKTKSINKSFN